MRTFYLFKINKEFCNLTKNCPLNLFKSLEEIYYTDKTNVDMAYNIFEQIIEPFKDNVLNKNLFLYYQENINYTKFNNVHMINDFYSDEQSKLIINKSFMLLKTNVTNPDFLKRLVNEKNIFVCDFMNKDYFWLESILV